MLQNINKIERIIKKYNITELNIFSFAIWDDTDAFVFQQSIQPEIEQHLKLPIIKVIPCEQLMKLSAKHEHIHYGSVTEFMALNGKYYGFQRYIHLNAEHNSHHILVDDCVPNATVSMSDTNINMTFIKI